MNQIIKSVSVKGLHGYLDIAEKFHSDINLLIGINGSGKTSLLNIINWVLSASIAEICILNFRSIDLKFDLNGTGYSIKCSKTASQVTISVKGGERKYAPLVIRMPPLFTKNFDALDDHEEVKDYFSRLAPTKNEAPTWDLITSLSKPFAINLNRQIDKEIDIDEARSRRRKLKPDPLRVVRRLTRENYSKYKNSLIAINAEVQNKVLSATFAFYLKEARSAGKELKEKARLDLDGVDNLESRINRHLVSDSLSTAGRLKDAIRKYFDFIRRTMPGKDSESTTAPAPFASKFVLQGHFERLNAIASIFEEAEQSVKESYSAIERYLSVINGFFRDSSKMVKFRDDTNELICGVCDKTGSALFDLRDISDLSSGETQILTLFSYLCFTPASVFLIDEPELSLHPRWQDNFLPALRQVMPTGSQVFIATHSPAIVGLSRDNVIAMTPLPARQKK